MWVYLQEVTEGAVSDGNIQCLGWVDVSIGLQLPILGTEGTWVKALSDFSVLFFINTCKFIISSQLKFQLRVEEMVQ